MKRAANLTSFEVRALFADLAALRHRRERIDTLTGWAVVIAFFVVLGLVGSVSN